MVACGDTGTLSDGSMFGPKSIVIDGYRITVFAASGITAQTTTVAIVNCDGNGYYPPQVDPKIAEAFRTARLVVERFMSKAERLGWYIPPDMPESRDVLPPAPAPLKSQVRNKGRLLYPVGEP